MDYLITLNCIPFKMKNSHKGLACNYDKKEKESVGNEQCWFKM